MLFKKCPNCESENPDTAEFCLECGAAMAPADRPRSSPVRVPVAASQPASPEPPPESPEEEPAEPPSPKSLFGERYRVLETVGRGRLGVVYKVFDKALERELALKSFGPDIARKPEDFEGFSRELRIERSLVHKNIARIFELNQEKGTPFITMEFVAGKSLSTLTAERGGRLPVDQAIALTKQLARALAEAHGRGAFHLDLRPSQILIDGEGTPKIIDFGVRRWLRAKGLDSPAADADSAGYASPEQLEGRIADQRSDIYSLGAILYELLTGASPGNEIPAGADATAGAARSPRNPRELNPAIKPELGLLVLRSLDADREKRYQTADDLWRDLENIEEDKKPEEKAAEQPESEKKREPAASPESPAPRPETPPRPVTVRTSARKPARALKLPEIPKAFLVRGAAALAVLILTAVVLKLAIRPGKTSTAELRADKIVVAVLPFEDASPAKGPEHFGVGLAEALIDDLNRLPGLSSPGVASSLSAGAGGNDVRRAGTALHADYVLTGSFESTGKDFRVDARLAGATDGAKVWEKHFDGSAQDFFRSAKGIAEGAGGALKVKVPPGGDPSVAVRPINPESRELYFKARSLARQGGRSNLERAAEAYQLAADKDPAWGSAWSGLANACLALGMASNWAPGKAFPRARQAVVKAMETGPASADTHLALALLKWNSEWDFPGAEAEFKGAIQAAPRQTEVHRLYSLFLSTQGRHDEAMVEIKTALALDPLSARVRAGVGETLYYARLYGQAAEELDRARDANPQDFEAYDCLGLLDIQLNDLAQSVLMFRQATLNGGDPGAMLLRTGYVLARLGAREEVGKILSEALRQSRETYVSSVSLAAVYAGLLEKEQALACLEKALAEEDASLVFLKVSPLFDSIRGDPQFTALLGKIGF